MDTPRTPYASIRNRVRRGVRFLNRVLLAPYAVNEDEQRQEHILNIILLGSLVLIFILDISVLYYSMLRGAQYREISFLAFSTLFVFFVCLYILSRKGYFRIASWLLVAAYTISLSYGAHRWGVNLQAVLLGYAFLVIMASVVIGTGFGFLLTSMIAISIIVLWTLQFNGILVTQAQHPNASDGFVFALLLGMIMVVSWLSNREIERSLARALRSEDLLRREKESLEIKAEQRAYDLLRVQSQKLENLHRSAEFGKLASGVVHDLLNIVSAISLSRDVPISATSQTETNLREARATGHKLEQFAGALKRQLQEEEIRETFSLSESIEQAVQLLSFKAKRAGVAIEVHLREGLLYVGNPIKFHQLLINLIMNAMESFENVSGRAPHIVVSLVAISAGARLTVKDNGCGIPLGLQEKIFEPFFSTKRISGRTNLGIGLASVRRIAEEDFRGTLSLKSEEGKGSCFTIEFPL